jgi:hypothetical protein
MWRVFGLACLAMGRLATASASPADVERGRQLFFGELPLVGRVTGHTTDLPPNALRCINCHAAGTAPPVSAGAASAASFGPALNADALTRPKPRRGGPPSRYDEQALCKLLTTGIDPAYIIIPRNMPRYTLNTADCRALWLYLSQVRK